MSDTTSQAHARRTWTVRIAGLDRRGERPYDWVVAADNQDQAIEAAMTAHLAAMEHDDAEPATPDQGGEPTYQVVAAVTAATGPAPSTPQNTTAWP